ncbi:MAG: hypothetical protein PXY39_02955 [archaeon]|nr:hypothetical protein [archaeon]
MSDKRMGMDKGRLLRVARIGIGKPKSIGKTTKDCRLDAGKTPRAICPRHKTRGPDPHPLGGGLKNLGVLALGKFDRE